MARFPFSELPPLLLGAHFFIPEFVGLGPPWGSHLSQLHSPRLNHAAKLGTVAEGSRRVACPTGAELGEVVNAVRSRDCRVSLVCTT